MSVHRNDHQHVGAGTDGENLQHLDDTTHDVTSQPDTVVVFPDELENTGEADDEKVGHAQVHNQRVDTSHPGVNDRGRKRIILG